MGQHGSKRMQPHPASTMSRQHTAAVATSGPSETADKRGDENGSKKGAESMRGERNNKEEEEARKFEVTLKAGIKDKEIPGNCTITEIGEMREYLQMPFKASQSKKRAAWR